MTQLIILETITYKKKKRYEAVYGSGKRVDCRHCWSDLQEEIITSRRLGFGPSQNLFDT